jgi:endonuclease/exonuclease/phosphatase family metal-dependent hydrolase
MRQFHDHRYRQTRHHWRHRHRGKLLEVIRGEAGLSNTARFAIFLLLAWIAPGAHAADSTLKIATWNLEWLISPVAFQKLKAGCAPEGTPVRGDVRRLPCDVAGRFERSSRDFAALARYARVLDADVVALQEVDGPEAARLVFQDHDFCFTTRRHVQNTGFAVRRGIAFRCGPDLQSLSLGGSLRRGAELTLFPGERREMRLLSVHLKSGCTSKPLSAHEKACGDLARQAPLLEAWIDFQARAGRRFAVLGDFNRDLLAEQSRGAHANPQDSLWAGIDDSDPPEADLRNAAEGEPFRNCSPGQRYRSYIDNIVLSRTLAAQMLPKSFSRVTYSAADARHAKLSDHCPAAVQLRLDPN